MGDKKMIWANLIHLGYNMWVDWENPNTEGIEHICAKPYLRFDTDLWNEIVDNMKSVGMNMVVLDLGEGVKYDSHPELAVEGSWSVGELKSELARLRGLGIEPIPKLNFSTTHDIWMGPYSRMVSTDAYYKVCADLIAETIDIFDKPRFYHLGMDEETNEHQRWQEYAVIRHGDLWWRDLKFYFDRVEKNGSRPWVWSDYIWHHPQMFMDKMPKSVLQSNWYYGKEFPRWETYTRTYVDLDTAGFEQIPTGSNWSDPTNFEGTVKFCAEYLDPAKLLGFMTAPWKPTLKECRQRHIETVEQVGRAKQWFESQK